MIQDKGLYISLQYRLNYWGTLNELYIPVCSLEVFLCNANYRNMKEFHQQHDIRNKDHKERVYKGLFLLYLVVSAEGLK